MLCTQKVGSIMKRLNVNRKIGVIGCGSYLPPKIVTNDELSKTLDTNHAWIATRTGICSRHIANKDERTSDLAINAVEDALRNSPIPNFSSDGLDGIIVATTTPDRVFPATAVTVQKALAVKHGFAFDIQAVCSGFLYALYVAASMIASGQVDTIAVIGADVMSRIVDWNDRSTCVLFGDGAGAFILQAVHNVDAVGSHVLDNNVGFIDFELTSNGALSDIMYANGGIFEDVSSYSISMQGREVYKHAVNQMSELCGSLLTRNNLTIDEVDWFIPHQANYRILEAVGRRIGINTNKIVSTIAEHANTSAASIPLAMDTYIKSGLIKMGQLVLFASAGAGMTFGSALLRY